MSPFAVTGSSAAPPATTSTSTAPATVDKNMFMQLLVAQLKNQDPLNPTDSTQFVSQLALFQQLEQSANTGQDISAMRQDLDQLVGATTAASTAGTVSKS